MSNILTLPGTDHFDLLDSVAQEFRRGLEELTSEAEGELSGSHFVFSRHGEELYPYFEDADAALAPGCIVPIKEGRPVASVDSTCVLVGESPDGALYAARTAVGVSREGALRNFVRLGPVLVYASGGGLSGICASPPSKEMRALLSDHVIAERVIRNTLERRVIESLLSAKAEMIVMADGSLKHPFGQFSGSLPSARGNCLVGFSKSSNLIVSERAAGSLSRAKGPAYHEVERGTVSTVLAKFAPDGLVFRLDLADTREPVESTLGRILWNEAFAAGYPESLKVAHTLSVFSNSEDQAMRALVARRFKLRQVQTFPLRTVAMGSFKGGA